jgi:PAS domain S-box-containing protein
MVELVENSDHPSWLLQTLLNQDNDAVEIVDPETLRFLEVNEKACKELGYTREEMLSLRVCDIDPTVNDAVRLSLDARLRQSQSVVIESIHRRKDGSIFPVEIDIKRVQFDRTYAIAIVRDITKRKRAEEAAENDTSLLDPEREGSDQAALLETDDRKLFVAVEGAGASILKRPEALPSAKDNRAERRRNLGSKTVPKFLEALLNEVDQIHGVSTRLEALAKQHPPMSSALLAIAGTVRNAAVILKLLVAIRGPNAI